MDQPSDGLARPQFDVLEEGPTTDLFVLENHRQRVAEAVLSRVIGMLGVQFDVQVFLAGLFRRDGEAVLARGVRGVLRLLQDLVLAAGPRSR